MILVSACTVGPAYKKPAAPLSAAYKEAAGTAWKPAQPQDQAARGKWWELFADPQLNALEEQVAVGNQNIAQAEAQFRGARAAVLGARAPLFPTVTAGAAVTRSKISANRSLNSTASQSRAPTTDFQLPVDLSYELDVWGRIRRLIEASVASAQASAADLEAVRLSMHAELALDYFQLRGLD
ncbi:MAG TPA: TolC family protein, partial [Thermoanaerobaculia bacterium]|nr:TolC family protein [Thermoanaerobaculia bacterium]